MIEIEDANVQLISSLPDELKAMPPDQQRQMEPGDQSAALQTLANLREAIATHDALCERAYARAHSLRTGDPLDEEEDVNFDEDEDEKPAYAWNVSRDFPQIRLVAKTPYTDAPGIRRRGREADSGTKARQAGHNEQVVRLSSLPRYGCEAASITMQQWLKPLVVHSS